MYSQRSKLILTLVFMMFLIGCTARSTPISTQETNIDIPPTNTPVPAATEVPPPTSEPATKEAPQTEPPSSEAPVTEPVAPSNTWMKTYGANRDDTVADILLTDDGGYYIAGATNIQFDGDMQADIYLLSTDAAGEVLGEQAYRHESEGYNSAQAIYPTDDGGLLISGVASSETGGMDIFLMKVDQDGNEVWSKTFGGPLDEFSAAWPMDDGGYILGGCIVDPNDIVVDNPGVAGYGGFAGRSNIYLARIDAEGNELWSHSFGGEKNVMASSGIPTPDGGFLILATIMYYPDNDDDIYLLKVDEYGNEVWSLTWEEGNLDGYEIIQTSDGNYLIAGAYAPTGDVDSSIKDFLFIKVDPDGNEIWTSIFGDPDAYDWAIGITESPDGGYVAVGEISKDLYTWDSDILLVKIDANGQLIWQTTIDTNTHTMLAEILQHPDGGYVIAGSTYLRGNFDILLIKTDADGNLQE